LEVLLRTSWLIVVVAALVAACVVMRRQSVEKFNEFLVPALLTAALTAGLSLTQLPADTWSRFFGASPTPSLVSPLVVEPMPVTAPPSGGRGWKLCEGVDADTLVRSVGVAPVVAVSVVDAGLLASTLEGALRDRVRSRDVRLALSAMLSEHAEATIPTVTVTARWTQHEGAAPGLPLTESVTSRGSSLPQARRSALACAARAIAVRAAEHTTLH
jgi:hypothetical protein